MMTLKMSASLPKKILIIMTSVIILAMSAQMLPEEGNFSQRPPSHLRSASNGFDLAPVDQKYKIRPSQNFVDVTINFKPIEDAEPNFEAVAINTTAVKVSCNHHICDSSMHTGKFSPILRITYRPLMNFVVWQNPIHCETKKYEASILENINDVKKCKDSVFKFGDFNDSISKDYSDIERNCETRVAYLKAEISNSSHTIVIKGLLPNQSYLFKYHLEHKDNGKTVHLRDFNHTDKVCMPSTKPLAPPQTDLGSFSIDPRTMKLMENDEKLTKYRKVALHWRPVPDMLIGQSPITYMLSCFTKIGKESIQVIPPTRLDGRIGVHEFAPKDALYTNTSYTCYLRANNSLGYADRVSPILIPSASSIIDTRGKFRFFVTRLDKLNKFDLRWNNIEEIMRNNQSENLHRTNNTNQIANSYTIYWCDANLGCPEILGMVKTRDTSYDLVLHNDKENRDLTFGISYRSANNQKFTGIIWADCVSNIKQVNDAIQLSWQHTLSDTSIKLKWSTSLCNSVLSLFDLYEIEYCHKGDVDQCLVPTNKWDGGHEEFDDKSTCTRIKIENNLESDIDLTNLKSTTRYVIRMRHWLKANGLLVEGNWSTPVMAYTQSPRCDPPWDNTTMVITLAGVMFVLSLVAWPVMRFFNHYGRMLHLFYNAKCSVPFRSNDSDSEEADNLSIVGLSYHINRLHIIGSIPYAYMIKEKPDENIGQDKIADSISNLAIKSGDQVRALKYDFHVEGLIRADQWQHHGDQESASKTDDETPEACSDPSSSRGCDSVSIASLIQDADFDHAKTP